MAYVFLIVSKEDLHAKSELATINDNLTYRLMAFEPESGKFCGNFQAFGNTAIIQVVAPLHLMRAI